MRSEGSQKQNTQAPPNITINTTSVDRSLLCFAVGQIIINIAWRIPQRPPLHRLGPTHWLWAALLGGFGMWSAYWLAVFAMAHASNPKWTEPIVLFGGSILLCLVLLEWGVFAPLRSDRARSDMGG